MIAKENMVVSKTEGGWVGPSFPGPVVPYASELRAQKAAMA